ncbi:MAG: hypothetical protein EZS26_001349 [Candidatus Ordinivivax streblomastigis]|uniref:Uncharacterized protein n=1 Tax=Candidatus Ordinivivax streblomastigis TaxID=2540710 RepID=A0A5M8P230_9BACT|nr:MAG: hypothetical protein EZS26_001349 [Candidatus Ordinivivax streblomastigis]
MKLLKNGIACLDFFNSNFHALGAKFSCACKFSSVHKEILRDAHGNFKQ